MKMPGFPLVALYPMPRVSKRLCLSLAPAAEPAYHKEETKGMHLQELSSLTSLYVMACRHVTNRLFALLQVGSLVCVPVYGIIWCNGSDGCLSPLQIPPVPPTWRLWLRSLVSCWSPGTPPRFPTATWHTTTCTGSCRFSTLSPLTSATTARTVSVLQVLGAADGTCGLNVNCLEQTADKR